MPQLLHSGGTGLPPCTSKTSGKARNKIVDQNSLRLRILNLDHFQPSSLLQFLCEHTYSDSRNHQLEKVTTSHGWSASPFSFYKGSPNLPAGLLVRLLPNPGLSKPSKSAKAVTAERSQKQIWAPGEGPCLWWEGRTQNILTPGQLLLHEGQRLCFEGNTVTAPPDPFQIHSQPFRASGFPSSLLDFLLHYKW